jgi:hypothetical protein
LTRILPAAALVWLVATIVTAQAPSTGDWQEAPGYLRLFAPSGPRAAAYRIYVSPLGLDTLLTRLSTDTSLLHPPGAWSPAALLPSDAFGETGGYDRSKIARLYGSKRAMVARGPRGPDGRPTEAWTLISPYPTRDMARLEPGTMLIVLELP